MKPDYQLADIINRVNKWNIQYYEYTNMLSPSANLSVYQSGHKSHTIANCECGPDMYNHYIIHYIIDGCGTYTLDNQTITLQTGDMFLIPPYKSVTYKADAETPWKYYWIGFNGLDSKNLMNLCGFTDTFKISPGINDEIIELFEKINHTNLKPSAKKYHLLANLYQLFSILIENNNSPQASRNEEYFLLALEYISEHFTNPQLDINSIAKQIGLHRSYLYKIFIAYSGKSIKETITSVRLNHATRLLEDSDISIGQVALECGFHSQSYFTKKFKELHTITPHAYRLNFAKK